MESDKRRSDRLMLSIPLRIEGTDTAGLDFREDGRTVTLNRHGAKILLARTLSSSQTIKITNLVSHRDANFRVVGPLSPRSEAGGEWGVERMEGQADIWGIQFPPPPADQPPVPAALVECRKCHTVAMVRLSLVEVEVLAKAGLLTKVCETCEQPSQWGYAEKQVAMAAPAEEAAMLSAAGAAPSPRASGADLRRYRRVALQLPVLIRDYSGNFEITKSENVSKGGFCFTSEKTFQIGEGVMVACPYSGTNQNLEVSAKIVRRLGVEGSSHKVYGVRYDQQSN